MNGFPWKSRLAAVKQGGKWGYVDKAGKFVIQPQFEDAYAFTDGMAIVKQEGIFSYIDSSGKIAINGRLLSELRKFSEGLACVRMAGELAKLGYGYINKKGEFVIAARFANARDFEDGLALVFTKRALGDLMGISLDTYDSTFIDKTGASVLSVRQPGLLNMLFPQSFSEGLAVIECNDKYAGGGDQYGYIDKSGNFVVEPRFDFAGPMRDGMAVVGTAGKYGYIDTKGKVVISRQFEEAFEFSEGLAAVRPGDKYGYVDKSGTVVIQALFEKASRFSGGMAAVKLGGKFGYIDKNGKLVISPQFLLADDFAEGMATVRLR